MKNKIALKLTLLFSSTLLLFSVIIGAVFISLFKSHTVQVNRSDMEKRAVAMADTISDVLENPIPGMRMLGGKRVAYTLFIRYLYAIMAAEEGTDIWIVDEDMELITAGQAGKQPLKYSDLPENAELVVQEVFQGKTTFSEGFSDLLNQPVLTVGTPIRWGGSVSGALLLHSPIEGMEDAVWKGFRALVVSILIALIFSVFLAVFFAMTFTKPLKKMKNSTIRLAGGDYTQKTGIIQKDEIGELASAIDELSVQLDIASREHEKLTQLRQDFVANISHELRTPVTVIRGSLEALCDGIVTNPEQIKNYHSQMLKETLFLQRLVNDLLDLSRLQNPDFHIEREELHLHEILRDIIRSAKQIAETKKINIHYQEDPDIVMVFGDYVRLRQMFMIILDNAVKFTPPGGDVIVTQKATHVTIRDTGIGIPKDDLPYIFDRFYKTKSEQNKTGSGLGLAIAKQIAIRHGITVEVDSNPGKGSEFRFEFQPVE